MKNCNYSGLKEDLRQLRLHYIAENYSDFVEKMDQKSPTEILSAMSALELTEKKQRQILYRRNKAQLGKFQIFDDFDWSHPTQIDRLQIEKLFELEFLDYAGNVILLGSAGVGKTMIAKNLALKAIHRGKTALFSTISKMITDLAASGHKFESTIRKYTRPDLLVLDELGYLSFQDRAADLLFEVVSRRNEEKSIVLTTNLAFKEWPTIFPGASCVTALVDRITYKCTVCPIEGDSYRSQIDGQQQNGGL